MLVRPFTARKSRLQLAAMLREHSPRAYRPTKPATKRCAEQKPPRHVALIMDGNRRWARERGLAVQHGHTQGLQNLVDLLAPMKQARIEALTVFAFASANWHRADSEVRHLMWLLERGVQKLLARARREGVRVSFIGRRDRLPPSVRGAIGRVEALCSTGEHHLRVALDYSSKEQITRASQFAQANAGESAMQTHLLPPVDLLIRTGREQRLSDFLLWECAFAELYFPDCYWPDFDGTELAAALRWYAQRERRMGV